MLEIQISEKRVESLWAHQGLIRINGMNVMSLPGEQFLNKGESMPPPSLPTYSHDAPHRLPLEGTAIRPSLDAGPSTCTSQTPEQLEIGFFINFPSLLYFVMPIWKELKEEGMFFLELDESAGDRVFLYFFEVRCPIILYQEDICWWILTQLGSVCILVTLCPSLPQNGIFQRSISDE